MKIEKVIPYRVWKNKVTGNTASIRGAVPYNNTTKDQWEIVTQGYTWQLNNGTYGLGRLPATTLVEANEIMEAFNSRY